MSTFDKCDLSGFIGKHLVYTYDNGWKYELYVKNDQTLDYRIHSGLVGNRWVKNQQVSVIRVGESVYKISWTEPTGTNVSLVANLGDKLFHGTAFFPRWVMNNPEKTVCFQNDYISLMESYRATGPAYPIEVMDEFAIMTFVRDCGPDDDSVIVCATSELPEDFPKNLI